MDFGPLFGFFKGNRTHTNPLGTDEGAILEASRWQMALMLLGELKPKGALGVAAYSAAMAGCQKPAESRGIGFSCLWRGSPCMMPWSCFVYVFLVFLGGAEGKARVQWHICWAVRV